MNPQISATYMYINFSPANLLNLGNFKTLLSGFITRRRFLGVTWLLFDLFRCLSPAEILIRRSKVDRCLSLLFAILPRLQSHFSVTPST